MSKNLLQEIDEYLSETGGSEYRFGFKAVRNGRLVERLREGRPVLTTTETAVREYIKAQRSKKADEKAEA